MSVENAQENVAPLRITISEVLSLLAQGKSRKEIAEHYGRTQTEMKKIVWDHPKLKNRKAKKQYVGIELEDDTEDINDVAEVQDQEQAEEQVQEEVAHVPGPEAVQAFAEIGTEETDAPDTSDWN